MSSAIQEHQFQINGSATCEVNLKFHEINISREKMSQKQFHPMSSSNVMEHLYHNMQGKASGTRGSNFILLLLFGWEDIDLKQTYISF